MGGEEGREMVCHSDRANSRASSAVWNAECFMEVEVAGIDSEFARSTDSDKGVQVCSIHINLSPRIVNFFADVTNRRFENTVSRWVGDHGSGHSGSVFFQFGVKVCEIHVALVVASDRNNSKTNEDCTGGVRSMGGDWN